MTEPGTAIAFRPVPWSRGRAAFALGGTAPLAIAAHWVAGMTVAGRLSWARMVSMATVLAFHAHPDDEVLTGGTLARLAAEGNRVIIVVATDGVMGDATGSGAARRLASCGRAVHGWAPPGLCIWAMRTAGTGRCCIPTRQTGCGSHARTPVRPPRSSPP